jgi:asparagine synthase (glutamine-hydrolysing)
MTGIAAIFAPGPTRPAQPERMMAAMHERVHDASGIWLDAPFALGALVLHTTAESLEAAQPLASEDNALVLVMDGYLTNWEELRRDLLERGAILRNRSDGELVLRAYQFWGEDCANRLEGEFAIVIADGQRRRLFAMRDHQGLRPLYVHDDGSAVLIASDLAAIVAASSLKPQPNLDYLASIAAGQWYQRDATVWQGVERVPQAHWLVVEAGRRILQQYYAVPETMTLRYRREQDYVDHYREVLSDAVHRTARSHRTLAVAVSGGLDSSSIFCLADQLERDGCLPSAALQGYTMVGEPGSEAYELPFARAAASHCSRTLVEVPLFRPELAWFPARIAADADVPLPPNAAILRTIEQRIAADGSRAILNGLGGDQWLDGTSEYYAEYARSFDVAGFARALARDVRAQGLRDTVPLALWFAASGFAPLTLRRMLRRRRRAWRYRNPDGLFWIRPEWRERLLAIEERFVEASPQGPRAQGNWNRWMSPFQAFALDYLQRQRAQSGIETREPMQTRQFISFCASAPKSIFRQAGVTKCVHRKAMRSIMPDLIEAAYDAPRAVIAADLERLFAQLSEKGLVESVAV